MTAAERIATLGGLGRIVPRAPGTVASVLAIVVAWGLSALAGQLAVIVAAVAATVVGFWGAELYARQSGTKDPSECVVDEVAGQLFACAFSPHALVLAFVLFRVLDIVKPWPIGAAERLPGGLGIMADDVIAGVLAGVLVVILFRAHLLGG